MSLTNAYVDIYGQLGEVFKAIQQGQAPGHFTRQHLKDLGFTSSNFRAVIPLLKELGFLSSDGQPTKRYHDYRDASQSKRVMGQALREAYGDVFVLRSRPTASDRAVVEGKFKSTHNTTDRMAKLMADTFFALLNLADIDEKEPAKKTTTPEPSVETKPVAEPVLAKAAATSLNYNIQIHLPATKDIEVFNAIFKSLREHLIE